MKKLFRIVYTSPRYSLLWIIRLYQKTLSLDHGPLRRMYPQGFCPFSPSCSEYGYQAIKKYGVIMGGTKTAWRILRCHPWTTGGVDNP